MDISTDIASSWRRTTVLIGVALALSACSGVDSSLVLTTPTGPTTTSPATPPSTAEPTSVTGTTATTDDSATDADVEPTSPSTILDDADAMLVVNTVIDYQDWDTAPDDIEVIPLGVLSPSTCELWAAGDPEILDGEYPAVVLLDHTPIAVGRNDDDLAFMTQRCFLDNGFVPSADVAAEIVALLSSSVPGLTAVSDTDPNRPIGTNQVPWQPPAVTAVDNGFAVTFIAPNSFAAPYDYRVTAILTATPDGAGNADVSYELL